MGAFTAFSLSVAVSLLMGWAGYRMFLAGCKQASFNRRMILVIYAVAFLSVPFMRIVPELVGVIFSRNATPAVSIGLPQMVILDNEGASAPIWPMVIVWVYLVGVLGTGVYTLAGIVRIHRIIRRGERSRMAGYTLVRLGGDSGISPFSFGRHVVVPEGEINPLVLEHELAHIRKGHRFDLAIAAVVSVLQWFNPAAWSLRSELQRLHEYEADETVLADGADIRQYQRVLVGRYAAGHFNFMTNSFTSNLKKRIIMMYQPSSAGRSRLRALVLVPALALAVGLVNVPAIASVLSATETATLPENSKQTPATDTPDVRMIVIGNEKPQAPAKGEVLPQYPGGEQAMFRFLAENIRYPESMIEGDVSGRVVVGFTVEADGSLSDIKVAKGLTPDADREAERVVGMMPKWIPASSDGKAVACRFALPVSFMLVGDLQEPGTAEKIRGEKDAVRVVAYKVPKNGGEVETLDVKSKDAPVIFVNGELFKGHLESISPEDIESMTVRKDQPEYPSGCIYIVMKKK